MRKLIYSLVALLALSLSAFAQAPDAKAKADEILKKARTALGGEAKLKGLQALSISGTQRATMGEMQMEGELTIDVMTPDKVMKSTSMQFGTNTTVLNGGQMWNEFVPAMGMGGGGMMIRAGGPGGGGPGGPGGPSSAGNAMRDYMQLQQRRELAQILLGFLLTTPVAPDGSPMQFTFVGEAPGPEESKLNVIDGKTSDNMTVRLYFDQSSNQLIGLSYKAKQMMRQFRRGGPGGPGGAPGQPRPQGQGGQGGQANQGGQGGQQAQLSPEEQAKRRAEMEQRMKERLAEFEKEPEQDFRWAFSDYKSVGGINFPHRITKSENGKPTEEWEISKIKVNPKLSADKFVKKEKDKAQN